MEVLEVEEQASLVEGPGQNIHRCITQGNTLRSTKGKLITKEVTFTHSSIHA